MVRRRKEEEDDAFSNPDGLRLLKTRDSNASTKQNKTRRTRGGVLSVYEFTSFYFLSLLSVLLTFVCYVT